MNPHGFPSRMTVSGPHSHNLIPLIFAPQVGKLMELLGGSLPA
jgi:hypothetical protein